MPLRLERLAPTPPWTIRTRIWADGHSDQGAQLAAILQRLAPERDRANVTFGSEPRDRTFVNSLGGAVTHSQIPELLHKCKSDNIQLSWTDATGIRTLDVVCELYDDHLEVQARSPIAQIVEQVLNGIE